MHIILWVNWLGSQIKTKYVNGKKALTYSYTKAGLIEGITDITGKKTSYAYDINGNLTAVSENGRELARYRYYPNGLLAKSIFANNVETEYTYDEEHNLTKVITRDYTGREILVYQYRYDKNGNRTLKQNILQDGATQYLYDNMNRLMAVAYPDGEINKYTFDPAGNRIHQERSFVKMTAEGPAQAKNYVEHTQYQYDERNRLLSETIRNVSDNGEKSKVDVRNYEYDIDGNLIREENTAEIRNYLYNGFRHNIQTEIIRKTEDAAERAALSGVQAIKNIQQNLYDADGMRYAIIENGVQTCFITNGWDVYTETTEDGKVKKRLIRGNGIVASEDFVSQDTGEIYDTEAMGHYIPSSSGGTKELGYHYYHANERGDIEYITDEIGRIRNSYTYDAFGDIREKTEHLDNRYTYNGEARDTLTNQYYLRARYYNPKVSRFTQEDIYRGDGLNLYAFCAMNPVMYVDPSGYEGTGFVPPYETVGQIRNRNNGVVEVGREGHTEVYRVIRPDEKATLDLGIRPKDITSTMTPADHVGDNRNKTSYNSTSVNMAETMRQSNKSGNSIVAIDLNKLPDNQVIVDLSRNDAERKVRLASNEPGLTDKAVYYAGNSSEVLIKGNIPADAVSLLSPQEAAAIRNTPKQQETIKVDKKEREKRTKCRK